jgi:hypothetical protein
MLGRSKLNLRRISEARDESTTPGLSFWSWDKDVREVESGLVAPQTQSFGWIDVLPADLLGVLQHRILDGGTFTHEIAFPFKDSLTFMQ